MSNEIKVFYVNPLSPPISKRLGADDHYAEKWEAREAEWARKYNLAFGKKTQAEPNVDKTVKIIEPSQEDIEKEAYLVDWEGSDRTHGHDVEHFFNAQNRLRAKLNPTSPATTDIVKINPSREVEPETKEKKEEDAKLSVPGTRSKTSLKIALEPLAKEEKTEKQKESPTETVVDRLHVNGRDVRSELQETIKRSFDLEHESSAVREATERLEKVNKERKERLKQEANPQPKPAVAETPKPAVVVTPTPETIRTQKEGLFVHTSMGYWEKINGKDTYVNKTYKQPLGESGESKLEQAAPATTPEPTPAPAKVEVPTEQPKKDASSPSKSPEDKATEEARIERRREKNRRKRARRKAKRAEARKAQEDKESAQVPAANPPAERLTPKGNGKDGEPKNKQSPQPEKRPESKPKSEDEEMIRREREQKIYRQGLEQGRKEGEETLWRDVTREKTIWERIKTPFKRKSKAKTDLEAYEIDEARKMAAIYVLGGVGFTVAALGFLQNYGIMLPVPINHLPLGWNPRGGFIPNK